MNDNTWLSYKLPLLQNRGHCAPCLLHLSESGWDWSLGVSIFLSSAERDQFEGDAEEGEGGAEQGRLDWPAAEVWKMTQAGGFPVPRVVFGSLDVGHTSRSSTDPALCSGHKCLWPWVWPKSTSLGAKAALGCDAANFPMSHLKYSREQKGKLAL